MEETRTTPRAVCGKEALDLLNCAAEFQFDRDKCLRFLDALRQCITQQKVKKFSLAEQSRQDESETSTAKL